MDTSQIEYQLVIYKDPYIVVTAEVETHILLLGGFVAVSSVASHIIRKEKIDGCLHSEPIIGLSPLLSHLTLFERHEARPSGSVYPTSKSTVFSLNILSVVIHVEPAGRLIVVGAVVITIIVIVAFAKTPTLGTPRFIMKKQIVACSQILLS